MFCHMLLCVSLKKNWSIPDTKIVVIVVIVCSFISFLLSSSGSIWTPHMKASVFLLCLSFWNNPKRVRRHSVCVGSLRRPVIGRQGSWWLEDPGLMICHPQLIKALTCVVPGMEAGSPGLFFYPLHERHTLTLRLRVHKVRYHSMSVDGKADIMQHVIEAVCLKCVRFGYDLNAEHDIVTL